MTQQRNARVCDSRCARRAQRQLMKVQHQLDLLELLTIQNVTNDGAAKAYLPVLQNYMACNMGTYNSCR